ncbi:MAG: amidohydrolase [Bacilli bacterium]|nr:amidohydrolase [Bacilli bacterium]
MKTLFTNARILTMNDGPKFLEGNLTIEGSRIAYVGKEKPTGDFNKVIDCKNMVLMPGLKNAHTHSAMTFLRGVGEGLPLMDWLNIVFPIEDRLTGDDIYWLTQTAFIEYVRGGTTACFDMYFFCPEIARASVDFGFRTALLQMTNGKGDRLEQIRNIYKTYGGDTLVKPMLGYHSEYTVQEDEFKELKMLADEFKAPLFTHISETEGEVKGSYERRGKSPVKFMADRGFLEYGGGGYHCIWFNDEDIEIFKKWGAHVVSCPGSNMKLKDGTAPLTKYWRAGLTISLGTDGASSNESLSMWREMHLASLQNPEIPDYEILKMATVNGALAMSLPECTTLEVGKKADIILVDADSIEELVHTTKDEDVKLVYIDGKEVSYDYEKIMKEASRCRKRLLQED